MKKEIFFFGEWQVDPNSNSVNLGKKTKQLEPKAMDVLILLCERSGEVLSSDDIVNHCWPDSDIGDNPLHKIINQLRRALDDKATSPCYIETIRKRGYRTIADVNFPIGHETVADNQLWKSGSPFPGLQAYSEHFYEVFFGRSKQISVLLERISQQVKFGRGFCLLLGPSGSGKSSLINAGIIPNLTVGAGYNGVHLASYGSLDFADVSKSQLFIELAGVMLDWEINDLPVFDGDSADSLSHRLITEPQAIVSQCKQAIKSNHKRHTHFALFIDRLEVLLSSPIFSQEQRIAFISILEQLANSGCILVLSACRNEFYPLLVAYPSLMTGKGRGAHFDLSPPTRSELLQMIRLPAVAANLTWTSDPDTATPLDEILCAEAASNPDALPMLQYMLQALYLKRSKDDQLLFSVYQELGGIEGAIGKNAEDAIAELTVQQKASLPHVLSLLVTLREDESSITSRTARWAQLHTKEERALTQAMINSRLFVSSLQNGEPCFSIAHEALLRRWPRATSWIAEHNQSIRIKSRLQHLSSRWLQENKHHAYLLADGKPLKEAQALKANPLFDLEPQEIELINASSKHERIKRWQKTFTVSLLFLLTITSILASIKSFEAEKMALQKRQAAENLLGFMVGDFADKMRGIGRMDLLDGINKKALEYYSEASTLKDTSLSFESRFQQGQTLEAMGEVAYSRGKITEAKEALLAAKEKLSALLIEQPEHFELLKTLGANAFWLGQLDYDQSDWTASKVWFEQYLNYSKKMYDLAPENTEALMELSYAYNSLGSISIKQQRFHEATNDFTESLKLKGIALINDSANSQLIADIADTRSWLATAAVSQGDINTGIKLHEQLQQDLVNSNINLSPYSLSRLFGSYHIHSNLLRYQRKYNKAFEVAMSGLNTIDKTLIQDPKNEQWQKDRFDALLRLLEVVNKTNLHRMEYDVEALANLLSENKQLINSSKNQLIWANYHLASARYFFNHNQYQQSAEYAAIAVDLFSDISSRHPDNISYKALLSSSQLLIHQTHNLVEPELNDTSTCNEVKTRLALLFQKNKHPLITSPYFKALQCLGEPLPENQLSTITQLVLPTHNIMIN
ncbi:winged helix-turn-helix domain-containing protein [Shewanella sp. 1_MG-2023]|uniref:nSTAND1 domain-containing NTPase n=1 Tax=unclassified Shewanella TaxID=196818 RepID=UPI0026E1DAF0|nr:MULTISPECIES: winged helix-turn-helix domain-containing protein [unclassified Shewanella]MDO6770825.1 winged helix-turn-helix domain-containing protein [Shewanella sp. 2_MG-2023]MDO6793157.1 winged helix-turn-helix domain-containing protein [Shewanella sp. 1_MG-2023]